MFLPEACDYVGKNKAETKVLSESLNGYLINEYKLLAKQYQVWLSIGGFHERIDSNTSDVSFFKCSLFYRKSYQFCSLNSETHMF